MAAMTATNLSGARRLARAAAKAVFQYAVVSLWTSSLWAHATGPDPRLTAAPGDAAQACTMCHTGTLNSGKGSVKITAPGGATYQPGAKHHIVVQVSDPDQKRWGFEFTARLATDLANGQAGTLTPSDANTQVLCDDSNPGPCTDPKMVQFIIHTATGTRNGTANGATFEFDWTAPAREAGSVTFFVAANAANGDGRPSGDHIYTSSLQMDPASGDNSTPPTTSAAPAIAYAVHGLVSDVAGLADKTDANLANPWGVSMNPTGAFWISNNRTGTSTVYNGSGDAFPAASPLVVAIAGAKGTGAPTGQVFNPTTGFELAPGKPATFLFATDDGAIVGWNSSVDPAGSKVLADQSGASAGYKALALGANSSGPVLYAANFRGGTVDAFDAKLNLLATVGGFKDPNLPAGFAPFNIVRVGRRLLVSYAKQDDAKQNPVAGDGAGVVDVFDMDGNLVRRLAAGGALNAPWGMAVAPSFFGDLGGALLVGNFGDGRINIFDLANGDSFGSLAGADGQPLVIEGLWALVFGNGRNAGDANTLYFTAGISGGGKAGDHGLFGSIQVAQ
jgi:uncharacterized protein (TIGR03118 family)